MSFSSRGPVVVWSRAGEDAKDRIKAAFKVLSARGYVTRTNFLCCQTCASYAIAQTPKFKKTGKHVFYHHQDNEGFSREGGTMLAWEGDGKEIVEAMKNAGLIVAWNGTEAQRIWVESPLAHPVESETPKVEEVKPIEATVTAPAPIVNLEEGKKPRVSLIGQDGNAFMILGLCSRAARKAEKPKEWIDAFMAEASAGDYNHLLATAQKYFDVN